jgi:hypothetical protein
MTSKSLGLVAAGAMAIALAGGAEAATINVINNSTQGVGNLAATFAAGYSAKTPVGASWTMDPTVSNVPLTVSGDYKSPFLNTALANTQSYFAADTRNAANGNGVTGMAELTYSAAQSSFKMLWGSVDAVNRITFFSGASQVFTYTGAELAALLGLVAPGPAAGSFEEVVLLSFGDFGSSGFDRITFTSNNRPAFEFALPAPIPVPAAGLMLLTALGAVAVVRRRKAA